MNREVDSLNNASDHYVGEKGAKYFARFTDNRLFGRIYQTRYFRPFVNDDLVVLDFGSNDGLMLRSLSAKRRLGIEVNEVARKRCHELNIETGVSVDIFTDTTSVFDQVADVVISNHTLEHVLSPIHALKELHRILRPSGKLVLVTPFDDWRNSVHRQWGPNDLDNHLHTWSPRNLGNLVTEAGFAVVSSRAYEVAVSKRLRFIQRFIGDAAFRIACKLFGKYKKKAEVHLVALRVESGHLDSGSASASVS